MFRQLVGDVPTRIELARIEQQIPSLIAQHIESLLRGIGFTLTRDTVLPSIVPTEPTFFWLDRQAMGLGDILYVSMQKSTGQWVWIQVIKAT